ncbi:aquaporin-like protein [Mytilinidion resinicola]|uniref:Aquaporin-like protein n=1 Tax=Mytilinidion resinicola TaxID=574789 RepID=A0A6A6XZC3_9PEZI|nr:aquaporin-like protein [Mytilinidion resinicola]KAF2801911.1 aquaporin-like protein [Mytilinidion resinicola]
MTDINHIERLKTSDMELGATEAVQRHATRHVVERRPISQRKLDFEHSRPRWLREMAAEATGVFFYVYPGIASTAAFFLNDTEPIFGSLFQIGWAYAIGIAFAIITCGPTSGGHFNPAITLCFAYWQGFPWKKVPYYIFAQIFGAFMAGMILMGQYHEQISAFTAASKAAGRGTVYNGGPASILCTFPGANQNNLGYLFLIEFFVDSFIGIVIWACLDPANPFVSPVSAPFTIGLAYANMVWGFANISISTNLARDLGTRIVAAIFFGGEAFSYKNYSWIAILVNVPATFFATAYYELVMRDSLKKIGTGRAVHAEGEEGLTRHLSRVGVIEEGMAGVLRNGGGKGDGNV